MTTYNIGDKIEVIGTDGIYTTYQEMADLLGSKLYRSGARPNLMEFEIVNKREHLRLNEMVYLLKNSDGEFLFTDDCNGTRFILIEMAKQEGPFLQTGEEFEHTKTLNFIYERLIEVHGENSNFDYMHKLKNAIAMVEDRESPCNQAALNKPKRVKVSYVSADFSKEWKAVRYYNEVGELFVVDFNGNYSNVNDISGTWYEVICKNYDSLFIQIETEIDERQEFIDAAIGVLNVHYQNAAATLCGDLFDSGKFKLVNAD